MNVNFGLFPPLEDGAMKKPEGHEGRWRGKEKAIAKKRAMTDRAKRDAAAWLGAAQSARRRRITFPRFGRGASFFASFARLIVECMGDSRDTASAGGSASTFRIAKALSVAPKVQYGALPWRIVDGTLEVMLLTSRDTGPLGHPQGLAARRHVARPFRRAGSVRGSRHRRRDHQEGDRPVSLISSS
jgi:hypothetical protein